MSKNNRLINKKIKIEKYNNPPKIPSSEKN